jgi:putative acetyltransferase
MGVTLVGGSVMGPVAGWGRLRGVDARQPPVDEVHIGEASEADTPDVLFVEREAFGAQEEADLVRALLSDPSAEPRLSLLARERGRPVGHVLFTAARLRDAPGSGSIAILAPLAVVPDAQGRGIGTALIDLGLQLLRESGVDLVFVLGHPGYYPRHGFEPAGRLGFDAPFPIASADADAWMVQALRTEVIGVRRGQVVCADSLNQPELWRE